MSSTIVNYDKYDYDYTQYWSNRAYEHSAECLVIKRFLKDQKGHWFIDIGGSYGRLSECYAERYKNCVILDYSLKTLQKNYHTIIKSHPNITLVAANAYKMPFKRDVFDGGLTVRVLHHIKQQSQFFDEVARVIKMDGKYILEFANKIHIKARLRAFFSNDSGLNDLEPYQQPLIHLEGAKDGGVHFLNYHPKYLEDILKNEGFKIEQKQGCSYLRIPFLKKFLGTKFLIFFEKLFQKILPKADISPSVFLNTKLDIKGEKSVYLNFEDILVCPACKHGLRIKNGEAECLHCYRKYIKKKGVWDFRIE